MPHRPGSRRPSPPAPRPRVSLRAAAAVAALAIAVGVAATKGATHPRFDPAAVGKSETRMWQAYYGGDPFALGREMLTLQMSQLGVTASEAMAIGEPLGRAAVTFSNTHEGYERDVLPALVEGYGQVAKVMGGTWDPKEAAKRELAWWVARRTPGENEPANVGRKIADLYALLYGKRNADIERAGLLRAQAAFARDKAAAKGQTPPWDAIEKQLVDSYAALAKGASR